MKKIATISPEIFPSYTSLLKLQYCDIIIFSDHLPFSKSHKYNQLAFIANQNFTFPIHTSKAYQSITFDESSNWRRKFTRAIDEFYGTQPYYIFFADKIKSLIKNSNSNMSDLSFQVIYFFHHLFHYKSEIVYGHRYQDKFNLVTLLKQFPEYNYMVEMNFKNYIRKMEIERCSFFDYQFIQPEKLPFPISKETAFLELFFSWGPYLNRLIRIA